MQLADAFALRRRLQERNGGSYEVAITEPPSPGVTPYYVRRLVPIKIGRRPATRRNADWLTPEEAAMVREAEARRIDASPAGPRGRRA